jgi:hypothetical protein
VQREPEPGEPFTKRGHEALGLVAILESYDEVVRETDEDHIALCLHLPPLLDPQVEQVVQVDIGQQRTDAPALSRPYRTARSLPVHQHAGP